MKQLAWHHALLLTMAVLVFFTNLGAARLWDRDEPRNAGCAEEMLGRGDLIVPTFNGQLRDAKPVLLYWLIMSAYTMFGVTEFAARFWSALLATGTVLATYQIGRRLFHPQVALWGALILGTSLMFGVAGRAATPDSALIFCGTMALMVYVRGAFPVAQHPATASTTPTEQKYFPSSWWVVALMYAVMGVGILAKGPVGLVLPTAVIGMFLLIVRLPASAKRGPQNEAHPVDQIGAAIPAHPQAGRYEKAAAFGIVLVCCTVATMWGLIGLFSAGLLVGLTLSAIGRHRWLQLLRPFEPRHFLGTCWFMRPLTALAVSLAVAVPWFIWVGIETDGEFLRGFFLKEHFGRATTAMENHSGSPLFYPLAILVGFFPWSVFMVPMLIDLGLRIRRGSAWSAGYLFLACWVGVYVGLFTLASTKLPSYVTPCYPALALIAGNFIYQWSRGRSLAAAGWPRLALVCMMAVGATMLIGLPVAAHRYLPGEQWLGVVGLLPLLGGLICLRLAIRERLQWAAQTFAATAIAFSWVLFGFLTMQIGEHQRNHELLDAITARSSDPAVASYGCLESTWVFYAKRPIRELELHARQEIAVESAPAEVAGPSAITVLPESREPHWAPRPGMDVSAFVADHAEPFIITTDRYLANLEDQLPADFTVLAEAPYFLKKDKLLLVGRPAGTRTADDLHDRDARR